MKIAFFLSAAAFLLLAVYCFYVNARTDRRKETCRVFLPNDSGVIGLVCMLSLHVPLGSIAFNGGSVRS